MFSLVSLNKLFCLYQPLLKTLIIYHPRGNPVDMFDEILVYFSVREPVLLTAQPLKFYCSPAEPGNVRVIFQDFLFG